VAGVPPPSKTEKELVFWNGEAPLMKGMDYVVLGVGQEEITFVPKSDRAKERTPEIVTFKDRASALEYMRATEAEGYRFLNARNLDETRKLVKYGYFVRGPGDDLIQRRQDWGPLDTDYESGDKFGQGTILNIFTGTEAESRGVGVMIVLDVLDVRDLSPVASPQNVARDADARIRPYVARYLLGTYALVVVIATVAMLVGFGGMLLGGPWRGP